MDILSKVGRKPGQEVTLDWVEEEAGPPVTELLREVYPDASGDEIGPVGPNIFEVNCWHPEGSATLETPETLLNIEEADEGMELGDFGDDINISLMKAQALRNRSQSVLGQSATIMEEATRSVEAAAKAYGQGVAANTAANMELP